MEEVDIIIIGAGVVGLAVASEISTLGRSVFILEKNVSWGQETSSRNSEVIHAGIYYKKDSLKAISCVEGRKALYVLCESHGIPYQKTGKLIVAIEEKEVPLLHELKERAAQNGVALEFIDKNAIKKKEPAISAVGALVSGETGIIDSHCLMKYYLEKAKSADAELVCCSEVIGIEKQSAGYKVDVNNQGEHICLFSKVVINCAGNNADKIAAMPGIDIDKAGYRQYYLKGNYFRLSDKFRKRMQHLVYPVPVKNSLGIHTVVDLNGGVRLGPDEEEVDVFDYKVDESRKRDFYESVKTFLPEVQETDLVSDMSGIRPQLRRPNAGDFKDFIICDEKEKGFAGLVNLIGIESPGLTASPYIASYTANIVEEILK